MNDKEKCTECTCNTVKPYAIKKPTVVWITGVILLLIVFSFGFWLPENPTFLQRSAFGWLTLAGFMFSIFGLIAEWISWIRP